MDLTALIICMCVGTFSLTTVYWIKSSEKRYRLDKTRRVDYFIRKNKVKVNRLFSGYECDVIDDNETKSIWYFTLIEDRLRYKQIPYDEIYRIEYKLDGVVIDAITRSRPSQRELVGGEAPESKLEFQSFIQLKDDIRAAKEFKLTVFLDDVQATSIDILFKYFYIPKEIKRLKQNEALEWFYLFKDILQTEERKQA